MEEDFKITLSVAKFKEILLHGWHLLPLEQQQELARMGIQPATVVVK
jgi:hypothetical protein